MCFESALIFVGVMLRVTLDPSSLPLQIALHVVHLDFHYVVQRPQKANIFFGSCQERNDMVDTTRLGITFTPERLNKLTPGMYFAQKEFATIHPVSTRGTVLGGRTAPREFPTKSEQWPSPCTYTLPQQAPPAGPTFKGTRRYKRFPRRTNAGPGCYDISRSHHRTIAFAYSLGGKRSLIPALEMKCCPVNSDVCDRCKKPPLGDYWSFMPEITWKESQAGANSEPQKCYLCRECYEKERRHPKLFLKPQLKQFKKVRDCSQVHFHDGCEARLLLLPPRDIEKIREKEAYLALYFQ